MNSLMTRKRGFYKEKRPALAGLSRPGERKDYFTG